MCYDGGCRVDMSTRRRRVRRQGSFGRDGACEKRHRPSPRAGRTDAHGEHTVSRGHPDYVAPHETAGCRPYPEPRGGMPRGRAPIHEGGGVGRAGSGALASHRGCRGRPARRCQSHTKGPCTPWRMRAQDEDFTGERVLPTSACRSATSLCRRPRSHLAAGAERTGAGECPLP